MFVPANYHAPDPAMIIELIHEYALATFVTYGLEGPLVTHVPAILDLSSLGDATGDAGLVGARVLGHMNRQNPHWGALRDGCPAVLVFHGPHGYVSPTMYGITPAAPTWNFTSVHVRGALELIEDSHETLSVIKRTVATFEHDLGTGWDMTSSLDYFARLLPGVGAFRLNIAAVDGMFKLSQEQTSEVRTRTACAFAVSERVEHRRLAQLMQRVR